LGLLASELAGSADRFTLFPRRLFGWLLVKSSAFHLAKNALALHFLLEYPKSLVDVVVANDYLQETFLSCWSKSELSESKGYLPFSDRVETTFGAAWFEFILLSDVFRASAPFRAAASATPLRTGFEPP
jgi:hypothetical protein